MLLHCPSLRLIDASLGELPHETLTPLYPSMPRCWVVLTPPENKEDLLAKSNV